MKKTVSLLPQRKEYCLLVKAAFDHAFCDQIIEKNKSTFQKANTHYPISYRNNERQVLDNKPLSHWLFQEIKHYLPDNISIEGIEVMNTFLLWYKLSFFR